MKLTFEFERATKNTFRFFELNEAGEKADTDEYMVGTLYVQKAMFDGRQPETIVVTIEEMGEE